MRDDLARRVLEKAMNGQLRSMYFEPSGPFPKDAHKCIVDALAAYGPAQMRLIPYYKMTPADIDAASLQMRLAIEQWRPDFAMFGYMAGMLRLEDLWLVRERCPETFTTWYNGDVVWKWDGVFDWARSFDMTVGSSPDDFTMFAEGGIDAGFMPGWTQHEYLQVKRELTPESPDVVFIGSLYFEDGFFGGVPFRREMVQGMAASGIRFDVYGQGWERAQVPSKGGTYGQYTRNAAIYAGAKIGLSVDNVRHKYCCCSDRPYNIAATGCMVLTSTFPGMAYNGWVDGKTCASFDTVPEMLEKARYYIGHDEERERIGQAGRKMTHKRHTWVQRIEALWTMMEGLGGIT